MGSSRKLFLLLGIMFVVLFLLSSQVAPSKDDQTTEHVDKKNGKVVHLPNTFEKYSGQVGYKPLRPGPVLPKKCKIYGQCLPPRPITKPRKCIYPNLCRRPCCGKAQEFTKDQFKDDFHN